MITAFNHYFPEKTKIVKAVMKFSGIGKKMAQQVLDRAGITINVQVANISTSKLAEIKGIIEQNYDIDDERREAIKQNVSRLSSISCYKGFRHTLGLPCRGQRTHGNAQTARRLRNRTRVTNDKNVKTLRRKIK